MMRITREKINTDIEQLILINLITNTSFISQTVSLINPSLFSSNYITIISEWCLSYFKSYNQAPKKQIEIIFKESALNMEIETRDNIADFLSKLSDKYINESEINTSYLIDQTTDFFKRKLYIQFISNIEYLKSEDLDNLSNLEENIDNEIKQLTSQKPSLFTFSQPLKEVSLYSKREESLVLSKEKCGELGKFLGDMRKEWLVSFQAPEKGGKSFMMNEMVFLGLEQNKKVLFISLEMGQSEVEERIYNRLTGAYTNTEPVNVYPVMDCYYNQNGECSKTCRNNRINIYYNGEKVKYPPPRQFSGYKPCTFCRNHITEYMDFQPDVWFKECHVKELTNSLKKRKIKRFNTLFPKNDLIVKSFPAMSATMSDIKQYVTSLENNIGFYPDMIVLDYIDILDCDKRGLSSRDKIDYNWKQAKQLAQEKHILLITGEQSRRLFGKEVQDVDDASEDKRKNAHIDAKFSINQTKEENDSEVRRLGQLLHRHRKVSSLMLFCLGFLEIAQPVLDCATIFYKPKTKKTNNPNNK